MSNLALGEDDFPAAAEKMFPDATVLHEKKRHDGAACPAGYVVETSLKTVLLLEALAPPVREAEEAAGPLWSGTLTLVEEDEKIFWEPSWQEAAPCRGIESGAVRLLSRAQDHLALVRRPEAAWAVRPRAANHRVPLSFAIQRAREGASDSEEQVRESISNEHPGLYGLSERLKESPDSREAPRARKELESHLARRWPESWSTDPERARPPARDSAELVDRPLRLGIFRERPQRERSPTRGRPELVIDVPDLHLEGLGLKRRGGVART